MLLSHLINLTVCGVRVAFFLKVKYRNIFKSSSVSQSIFYCTFITDKTLCGTISIFLQIQVLYNIMEVECKKMMKPEVLSYRHNFLSYVGSLVIT